jgi:hypothetical protein
VRGRAVAAMTCVALLCGAGAATAAGAGETARVRLPATVLAGTWSWQDLDEALSSSGTPIRVRIATSRGRPVVVFSGQQPVFANWNGTRQRLRFTARRVLTGTTTTVSVRYSLRASTAGGRVRLSGLLVIRSRAYPGASAVEALLVERPA